METNTAGFENFRVRRESWAATGTEGGVKPPHSKASLPSAAPQNVQFPRTNWEQSSYPIVNRQSAINNHRGFTLIELIATVAIISILSLSALPLAKISIKRQKEMELRRSLREMREAIDRYKDFSDRGFIEVKFGSDGYPADLETLVKGVNQLNAVDKKLRFLRRIPIDPMTGKPEWGLRSSQDSPDSTTYGGQNVYDVYTKSTGIGLDGSKYSEW